MTYQHYTPEFKAKIVLQVLQGEKEIGELGKENNINPNLIRKWRTTFLEKAATVFEDPEKEATKAKRKEESLEKMHKDMLSTIGQLTLERNFLQDAFRRSGQPVPRFNPEDE
jgi:transposase-like protein